MTIDKRTIQALLKLLSEDEVLEVLSVYHDVETIDAIIDLIAKLKEHATE